jgi:hypothetical protein
LSFGPRRGRGARWPGTRGGWIAIVMIAILLAGTGTAAYLALLVARQDHTIGDLRADLRSTARRAPAGAVSASGPALPVDAGSAMFTLPEAGGPLSVVAAAVRPGPGSGKVNIRARATACSRAPAEASTSRRPTSRTAPRTGRVT